MGFGTFSGDGLGFGLALTLDDFFTATAQAIDRQMGNLGKGSDRMAAQINRAFGKIQAGAAMVLTGFSIAAPLVFGVKIEAEFERARLGLETLLKSKTEADKVFNQTAKDAAATPFELQPLLMVNKALISAGVNAKEARTDTLALANAIAATGGGNPELERMAINMQQIKSLGKASAVDLKQFAYAGINIYQLLADATGKSVEQAKEMEVTYDLLSVALRKAAEAGGLYEGALEKLSKSAYGKMSSISDNINLTFAELGKVVLEMLHPVLDMILTALDAIREFMQSTAGKIVSGILSIAIALAAVAVIGVGLKLIFMALWTAVLPILTAAAPILLPILALGAAIIVIKNALEKFNNASVETLSRAEGLRRVFLQLGGIFRGIYEVWSSIDFSKGRFSLGEETLAKLKALGIDKFVINLGTWLVRLKAFFKGFFEGMGNVLNMVKVIILAIYESVAFVLSKFGVEIGKTTSNVDKFIMVGKALAYVVGTLLVAAFVELAIAMLPEIIILGAIILVIWALYEAFQYLMQAFDWVTNSTSIWAEAIRFAIDIILGPLKAMIAILEYGLELIADLGDGLTSMDSSKAQLAVAGRGGRTMQTPQQILQYEARQKAEIGQRFVAPSDNTSAQQFHIINNVHMDGKVVAKSVNKLNADTTNRQLNDQ